MWTSHLGRTGYDLETPHSGGSRTWSGPQSGESPLGTAQWGVPPGPWEGVRPWEFQGPPMVTKAWGQGLVIKDCEKTPSLVTKLANFLATFGVLSKVHRVGQEPPGSGVQGS